ncbi:MAG TPA: PIN domain-containing protein [Alphaproteobacteria bacterium]|nr:PIN domain-containing protein [Alphaproteobacteria bacterium]
MTIRSCIKNSTYVFLDTAPLIYFIEAHPVYGEMVRQFILAAESGKIKAISSVITLHEVLVQPYRNGNDTLAEKFSAFLKGGRNITLLPISDEIAEAASRLRGRYLFLKLADAMQIATALHAGADLFLTNDKQLKQLTEIPVAVLDECCKDEKLNPDG